MDQPNLAGARWQLVQFVTDSIVVSSICVQESFPEITGGHNV